MGRRARRRYSGILFPEAAVRLRLPVTDPEIGWVLVALVILGGALGVLWVRFRM